jgi:hypothetical protein
MAKQAPVTKTVKGKEQAQVEMVGLDIGKVPPQALDIEEAVLGALLLEPGASLDIVGAVKPEYFYKDSHQKIFSAIMALTGWLPCKLELSKHSICTGSSFIPRSS